MKQMQYSAAVKIVGAKGDNLGRAAAMPDLDGSKFINVICDQLKTLSNMDTGQKLLKWIDFSGKKITIYCAVDGLEYAGTGSQPLTEPEPQGWGSTIAACVRPFRKAQVTIPVPKARERKDQVAGFKNLFRNLGLPTTKAEAAPQLETILKNAARGIIDTRSPKFTNGPLSIQDPVAAAAQTAGISEADVMHMAQGTTKIPDDVYFKLAFFFYDFLTAGRGVDTSIRMINTDKWPANFKEGYKPKTNANDSPGYIVLGHELIHALRMMIGKRLVHNGWEEEAMTSGIWNFSGWHYTENSLRAEKGLPLRMTYQCVPHVNSPWVQGVMVNQGQ